MRAVLLRLAGALPTLAGVVVVTFLLTRVLPGDTATYFAGPTASPESIAQIKASLGLDQPPAVQFWRYVVALSHGELGMSLTTGRPVLYELATRLPTSVELTLSGLFLTIGIAVPFGVMATVRQGSFIDHACRMITTAGDQETAAATQPVLPACTLALFALTPIPRITRASMLVVLGSEIVRTARASGLSPTTSIVTYTPTPAA